jgi:hypothetical protein
LFVTEQGDPRSGSARIPLRLCKVLGRERRGSRRKFIIKNRNQKAEGKISEGEDPRGKIIVKNSAHPIFDERSFISPFSGGSPEALLPNGERAEKAEQCLADDETYHSQVDVTEPRIPNERPSARPPDENKKDRNKETEHIEEVKDEKEIGPKNRIHDDFILITYCLDKQWTRRPGRYLLYWQ